MKKSKLILALLLVGIGLIQTQAQQTNPAIGGNDSGIGGTVSFSIGQIVYTTYSDPTGSVAQGVQQAYEISIVSGIEDQQIRLNMQAYPNPTSNNLTLNLGEYPLTHLNYQLYDLSGRLIENKKISFSNETIQMEELPSAIYFLKVVNKNIVVKTFKIIKS